MRVETSDLGAVRAASPPSIAARSDAALLRPVVVATGISWSVLFLAIGLGYELQLYGDGSLFSYAVAVHDGWAYHWHNISGRLFVYLFSVLPAESYVELTGDAAGGVFIYGLLFFSSPALGLMATFAADRSADRVIFAYACFSTACLCPLVFGFPTEVWMTHALFWPTLALCHHAREGIRGTVLVFASLLALILTHGGALIFAAAILATLLLRGTQDPAFVRAWRALIVALTIWAVVLMAFPPDDYIKPVLVRAALHVFDVSILTSDPVLLLFCTLASYGMMFCLMRRVSPASAPVYAAAIVGFGLAVYWTWFDHTLYTAIRYYMRTILLIVTPVFGMLAAVSALDAAGRLAPTIPHLRRVTAALAGNAAAHVVLGGFALVMLVHAVETARFVGAWTTYQAVVRSLAMSAASDAELGDPQFVSSERIRGESSRLSWFSTTPYLSVLVAPGYAPARLVVDPKANYFWLSCETALASLRGDHAVPENSRRLIRKYSCLHRK